MASSFQPKCPACKQAVSNNRYLCPCCLARTFCSAICLNSLASKCSHRKECAQLAFACLPKEMAAGPEGRCNALIDAGGHDEAEAEYERLLRVGEMGLLHRGEEIEVRCRCMNRVMDGWID